MGSGRQEMGLVEGDQCSHVLVPNLTGAAALCGSGKITKRLPGMFNPDDPLACVHCIARLRETG